VVRDLRWKEGGVGGDGQPASTGLDFPGLSYRKEKTVRLRDSSEGFESGGFEDVRGKWRTKRGRKDVVGGRTELTRVGVGSP